MLKSLFVKDSNKSSKENNSSPTNQSTNNKLPPLSNAGSASATTTTTTTSLLHSPPLKSDCDQQPSQRVVPRRSSAAKQRLSGSFNRLKPIGEDQDLIDEKNAYRVFDGLGVGQFATVVKVEDISTKKVYALKVCSKTKLMKQREREQLAVELEVMIATKGFPFLQTCHHAFETETMVYFVNDFIGGGDLFYHLAKRYKSPNAITNGFKETEARILLSQVYLGLKHMHIHHFLHRDVKIENIVLDLRGNAKLIDFGLAMEMSHSSDVQIMDRFGSLTSMAPELINYQTGGRHTDWWAFGVLAYELMTGNTPWSDMSNTKLMCIEIISKKVQPPKYLSKAACKFIQGLLAKDYKGRLGTKSDMEIMTSLFFKPINWTKTLNLQVPSAFLPESSDINVDMEDRKAAVDAFGELCRDHQLYLKNHPSEKKLVSLDKLDFDVQSNETEGRRGEAAAAAAAEEEDEDEDEERQKYKKEKKWIVHVKNATNILFI